VCCPAKGKEGIEVVMHICVRALTLMRLTCVIDDGSEILTVGGSNFLSSIFLEKTDARSQKYVDLVNDEYPTGKDRVSNHF